MRKKGIRCYRLPKFLSLIVGIFLLFGMQSIKIQASTTSTTITNIYMDKDIKMNIDGKEVTGKLKNKIIRLVDVKDKTRYFTKTIGNEISRVYDGTYDIYDLTEKRITSTSHYGLKPSGTISASNGVVTSETARMNYYNVTFYKDINDTTKLVEKEVVAGNKVSQPTDPSKDKHTFIGWVDKDGNAFNFDKAIEGTTEVYAKWEKKYAILVVAGQSNAVGYDESDVIDESSKLYEVNPRVNQLGLYGDDNLKIIPLTETAQNFQDMRRIEAKGIQLPLGNLLLNYIPEDYEIVIIPAAYGGTGFTTSASFGQYDPVAKKPISIDKGLRWGVTSAYYETIKGRIGHLLDLNPDNYYIGTVWCQGEHDGANPSGHKTAFEAMTNDFFAYFNANYPNRGGIDGGTWSKDQWFIYESVPYWTTVGKHDKATGVKQIFENYKAWSTNTYVDIDFGEDSRLFTNETNGATKGTIYSTSGTPATHYGNGAFAKLVAPKVIEKMEESGVISKIQK